MNKKATHQQIKHQPHKKSAVVRDSRGFVTELPKPHKNQVIIKGL